LPIYGRRTSFEQAVVVTALLLDFVRGWAGEIPIRRFTDILHTIPQCYLSSTIVISSEEYPLSLALDCALRRLNKVVALIDKLISLGWLRVRVKHWHRQGTKGRATAYALGSKIRHCWVQSVDEPPHWCSTEMLMEGERLHLL
jgi:hypothetical protein